MPPKSTPKKSGFCSSKKIIWTLLILACLGVFLRFYGMRILVSLTPFYVATQNLPPNITPSYYNYDGEKEGIFTHRFVHINETLKGKPTNVTYHVVTAGNPKNPAVVLFHGASDTWFMWSEQMKDLSDEFYLLSFDMKGLGQSSKPYSNKIWPELNELGGDYTLEMSDEEYVTAIDKLGVKQFHLVTWDLSSFVMHALPAVWKDRVLSYIKGQSTVAVHNVKHVPQFKFFQNAPKETWQFMELVRDALVRSLYSWPEHAVANCRSYQKIDEKTIERAVHEWSYPGGSARGWVSYLNSLEVPVLDKAKASYAEYECPVFIFQGARDPAQPPYYFDGTMEIVISGWAPWPLSPYFPWGPVADIKPTNSGKHAIEYFPKAPVAVYESVSDAGHFLPLEKPRYTSDSMRAFLKGNYDEVRKRHANQPKIELDDCAFLFGQPDPNCRKGIEKPTEEQKTEKTEL